MHSTNKFIVRRQNLVGEPDSDIFHARTEDLTRLGGPEFQYVVYLIVRLPNFIGQNVINVGELALVN